jgi:hypothetical protein
MERLTGKNWLDLILAGNLKEAERSWLHIPKISLLL